jgi:hypothetical protein
MPKLPKGSKMPKIRDVIHCIKNPSTKKQLTNNIQIPNSNDRNSFWHAAVYLCRPASSQVEMVAETKFLLPSVFVERAKREGGNKTKEAPATEGQNEVL